MTDKPEAPRTVEQWMQPVPILPGDKSQTVWTCKIGVMGNAPKPHSADGPMRLAVERVFRSLTGRDAEFCFSGWGGTIDECELAVVEDRLPNTHPQPDASALVDVLRKMLDDYQTSDAHHPLHVLVRLDHFDEARAALAAYRGGDNG